MSNKIYGGAAFPSSLRNDGAKEFIGFHGEKIAPGETSHYDGMSLRDYFAAKAMVGALSACSGSHFAGSMIERSKEEDMTIEALIAMDSYAVADAMLAERAKGESA